VESVAQYHEPDPNLLSGGVQYFANFPARCHHPIEEMIYDVLKARSPLAAKQAICVTQHERIIEQIGELAMMTRNLFLDAPKWRVPFCATARRFITLKRDHIREEEKVLFRIALEYLSADDWRAVDETGREAHIKWANDPAHAMAYDVLGLKIDRGARASGSARRQ
jgi:hemerythrin-like domain-containing protein